MRRRNPTTRVYWIAGLAAGGAALVGGIAYVAMRGAATPSSPSDTAGVQPPGTWQFTLVDTDGVDGTSCFVVSSIASVAANQQQANTWAKAAGWGGGDFYSGVSNITGAQTIDSMSALQAWINTQPTT